MQLSILSLGKGLSQAQKRYIRVIQTSTYNLREAVGTSGKDIEASLHEGDGAYLSIGPEEVTRRKYSCLIWSEENYTHPIRQKSSNGCTYFCIPNESDFSKFCQCKKAYGLPRIYFAVAVINLRGTLSSVLIRAKLPLRTSFQRKYFLSCEKKRLSAYFIYVSNKTSIPESSSSTCLSALLIAEQNLGFLFH
jgi:hypothetical protein